MAASLIKRMRELSLPMREFTERTNSRFFPRASDLVDLSAPRRKIPASGLCELR
jgi:hypothetical protein